MRYRVEYLHLATSARLTFTVQTPGLEGMARSAGNAWLHAGGLHLTDFAFLGVVRLGEDHRAHPAEVDCDILSRVPNRHHGEPTVHEGVPVGRDAEREGAPGGGEGVLAP